MRFRSNIILNIPQYYFHMAAILKNGCHFFRQGSPPRSCAGRSPEHVDTQHLFTTAHVRWTPKSGGGGGAVSSFCGEMNIPPLYTRPIFAAFQFKTPPHPPPPPPPAKESWIC